MLQRDAPPQSSTPNIANEINAATRSLHTELNKLIIARLPVALPPFQTNALPYTIGISAFARVFSAFEAAWDKVLSSIHEPADLELLAALDTLLPSNLRRTHHFHNDLHHLRTHISSSNVAGDVQLHQLLSTVLATAHNSKSTSSLYISHITQTIAAKPHVIIAYAWVMYMALFSGGRWIRGQLRTAGDEFWMRGVGKAENVGYSFLSFEGECDGEDIKADFKMQLARVEAILTPAQRADVVCEAQEVFRRTLGLVGELDELVAGAASSAFSKGCPDFSAFHLSEDKSLVYEKRESVPEASLSVPRRGYAKGLFMLFPALVFILTIFMMSSNNPIRVELRRSTT